MAPAANPLLHALREPLHDQQAVLRALRHRVPSRGQFAPFKGDPIVEVPNGFTTSIAAGLQT